MFAKIKNLFAKIQKLLSSLFKALEILSQRSISTMTLKTKLALILIPLIVIPIALLGKLSYEHIVSTTKQTVLGPMNILLNQVYQKAQYHLQTAVTNIQFLSQSGRLTQYLSGEDKATREVAIKAMQGPTLRLLASYAQAYPYYYEMRVILPNGEEIIRFPQESPLNLSKLPYFQTIQSSSKLVEVFFTTTPSPAFIVAEKLTSQVSPEETLGYLLIAMRPTFLTEHVKFGEISENGYLFLTDGQGRILLHPQPTEIDQVHPELIKISQQTTQNNPTTMKFGNRIVYLQGQQIHPNLHLFALLPEQDVLVAGHWVRRIFTIAMLATTVITLGMLFLALKILVIRPLQELAKTSRDIGAGNLEIQLPARHPDEIGTLYFCFNHMVKRLRTALQQIELAKADLEEKVRLRTLNLQQLNLELEIARQRADAANLAKSEFMANISHELRTPLNGILGMTELILNTPLSSQQKRQLNIIYESGEMLLTLINDLLDVAKFEAGKMKLEISPFDLLQTTQDVMAMLRVKAQEKNLVMKLQTTSNIPRSLTGDKNRFKQILLNLVGNSIKFTEVGGVTVVISLAGIEDHSANLEIKVIDTGIGIPTDEIPNLFNKFHQVDSSSRRKYGGTGLGLFICHQLVDLMNGQIGVETQLGQGCSFWFRLTLPIAPTPPITDFDTLLTTPPHLPNLLPTHILLVEDDKINQLVAKMMLEELGCQVSIANHGQEAVDMCIHDNFDVVLMDLHMPVLDGYAATRDIRQGEAGSHLPIIALTANALPSDLEKCLEVGMNDVLVKPVTKMALTNMLKKWLGRTFSEMGG